MTKNKVINNKIEKNKKCKELKQETSIAEKQYQKFDNVFESNKKEEYKTGKKEDFLNSNLVYDNYFTFYKYHNIKEFTKLPLDSKLNLKEFKNKLELFYHDTIEIKPNNEDQIKDLENTKVVFYIALNYIINF